MKNIKIYFIFFQLVLCTTVYSREVTLTLFPTAIMDAKYYGKDNIIPPFTWRPGAMTCGKGPDDCYYRSYLEYYYTIPADATITSAKLSISRGERKKSARIYFKALLSPAVIWDHLERGHLIASEIFNPGESKEISLDITKLTRTNLYLSLLNQDAHVDYYSYFNNNVLELKLVIKYTVPNRPPTTPTGLSLSGITNSLLSLDWNASTDEEGDLIHYSVYKDDIHVANPVYNYYHFSGLSPCTSYTLKVQAIDDKGAKSGFASIIAKTAGCCEADITLTSSINGGTHSYLASNSITASNSISGSANVHYGATNLVRFLPGFSVAHNCTFTADNNGCNPGKSTIDAPLSADDYGIDNKVDMKLYPNPSNGNITFKITGIEKLQKDIQVEIYDLKGSKVYSTVLRELETSIKLRIEKGLYLLKAIMPDKIITEKILIE